MHHIYATSDIRCIAESSPFIIRTSTEYMEPHTCSTHNLITPSKFLLPMVSCHPETLTSRPLDELLLLVADGVPLVLAVLRVGVLDGRFAVELLHHRRGHARGIGCVRTGGGGSASFFLLLL